MKKLLALILSTIMMVGVLAGCGGDTSTDTSNKDSSKDTQTESTDTNTETKVDVIKVGVVEPLTGGSAYNGAKQVEGIKAYVDMVNENGGIASMGGAKIELIIADSASSADIAATEAERLINDEGVCAILGCYNSGAGVTVMAACEKNEIPFVICNAIADNILYDASWGFRVNQYNTSDSLAAVTLINDLNKKEPGSVGKIAFVIENSEFGSSIMDILDKYIETETDAKIGMVEYFDVGITDFSAIFNKIKASDCDTIYVCPAYTEGVLFVNQYHEYQMYDYNLLSLGYGMVSPEYVSAVGELGEGIILTTGWSIDIINSKTGEVKDFCLELCEEYAAANDGIYPDANYANGWLASGTLMTALEEAGSTKNTDLQNTLNNIKIDINSLPCMFHGYGVEFGEIYDMTGQNVEAYSAICQIIDGEFRMVCPDEVLTDNPIIWPVKR